MKYELESDSMGRNAVGETLLDVLQDARVLWLSREKDGRFEIREACDKAFAVWLDRKQLIALADEIRAFADKTN